VTVLRVVLVFCEFCDIFILLFVENKVGVGHKYKKNTNAENIYESLLLKK
jgi:hypothetical protein